MATGIRLEVDVKMRPREAFRAFVDELSLALVRLGLEFSPGPRGRIREGEAEYSYGRFRVRLLRRALPRLRIETQAQAHAERTAQLKRGEKNARHLTPGGSAS